MLSRPKNFGVSVGGFRPTETQVAVISLLTGGMDNSVSPIQLEEGGSPYSSGVQFLKGGIYPDYNVTPVGTDYGGSPFRVIHVAPYEKEHGTMFLMRLHPNKWDRWNGTNWLTIPGSLTSTTEDRVNSVIFNNKFIVANNIDPLSYWDGVDANPITTLSADAPIAKYLTRIGTRLLVAGVTIGGDYKANIVAWSADDDETEWTDALQGAGSAELFAEGSNREANVITGLSTVARGAVIYRQSSIQLGLLTGSGASPFRFTTVDFSNGTKSPFSIASGGMRVGDFYLGADYMPYNFNGEAEPIPIGAAIHDELIANVKSRYDVIGTIDAVRQEYWIGYPTFFGSKLIGNIFAFDIREWATRGKMRWRRTSFIPPSLFSMGFATVSDGSFVDDLIVFGHSPLLAPNGRVSRVDKTTIAEFAVWQSKQFSVSGREVTTDRIRFKYSLASGTASVGISVSVDGGQTFTGEQVVNLAVTGNSTTSTYAQAQVRKTGRSFQVRVRFASGQPLITELEVTYQDLGQTNA